MQEVRGSILLSSTVLFNFARGPTKLRQFRTILIIGVIEICIGSATLLTTLGSLALGVSTKTPNVLLFVIVASIVSTSIGIGILKFKKIAYDLLLYFSSVVLFSKLLIFMDIIQLNGALETAVPGYIKDSISIVYHGFVIYYLKKAEIKQVFHFMEDHAPSGL